MTIISTNNTSSFSFQGSTETYKMIDIMEITVTVQWHIAAKFLT